jgi:hypothetical protein
MKNEPARVATQRAAIFRAAAAIWLTLASISATTSIASHPNDEALRLARGSETR